ncbi:MAG TPA: T9SS type A sorting domain-containing protein, partial [Rhodothermia bacterium]|nr:T9SS type A sorting domain-containing protein [Rhodothermia bacterium]
TAYALHDNYPNPFNPTTSIVVDLPQATTFTLTVYDVEGHKVMVLDSGTAPAGRHTYTVDGSALSSGMYLYRIESAAFTQTKRMMLLK